MHMDEKPGYLHGFGNDRRGARKNTIQKAVRKALGEIVDAETITNNEEIIKDGHYIQRWF